jgi:hypothetical protein
VGVTLSVILLEATRPQIAYQAEMRRVWATMDRMDDESARRVLVAVADMRKDVLDRLAALPTTTIEGAETFQATSLRLFASELDDAARRFSERYSRELGTDMRAMATYSDEAHRAALDALARAQGVPPSLIHLSTLGVSDAQIEAAVLLNQSAIKNVSQAVVSAVNGEVQGVVFGMGSRWDAVRNIRAALGTTGQDLGALTQRALTIERTALIQVFNVAAEHSYRQAVEELPDLQVEWMTALDKRVDPICVGLSGALKKPGGTFPGGYMAPPAHPRCRCRLVASLPAWGAPKAAPAPARLRPPAAPGTFRSLAEAERDMKRHYPNIKFDFDGAHIDTINPSMAKFHALSQEWPEVAARLEYVGTLSHPPADAGYSQDYFAKKPNTWAFATRDGKMIALNPTAYADPAKLASDSIRAVRTGFHPPGTEPIDSIITHEFGHLVDNWSRSRGTAQVTPAAWFSGLGLRNDTVDMWLKDKKRATANQTQYAKTNNAEQFAELFAATYYQEKPAPVVKQFSQLIERVVKAPAIETDTKKIRWISDLPYEDRPTAIADMRTLGRRLGVKWP